MIVWTHDVLSVLYRGFPTRMVNLYYISCLRYTIVVGNPRYARVSYFCICTCSAQLSMFHMERRSRNTLIIIIIIIIIIITCCLNTLVVCFSCCAIRRNTSKQTDNREMFIIITIVITTDRHTPTQSVPGYNTPAPHHCHPRQATQLHTQYTQRTAAVHGFG